MRRSRLRLIAVMLVSAGVQLCGGTLVEAGRVLDVRSGSYLKHAGILIDNERIVEVGDYATVRAHAPKDAVTIDLHDATVLPGLIDCHAHLLAAVNVRNLEFALTVMLAEMSPSKRALLGARNAREDLEAGIDIGANRRPQRHPWRRRSARCHRRRMDPPAHVSRPRRENSLRPAVRLFPCTPLSPTRL